MLVEILAVFVFLAVTYHWPAHSLLFLLGAICGQDAKGKKR